MKKKNLLLILVPVAVMMLTLVGCSDYDNGFTEKEIQFQADFNHYFGSYDKTQDWNLAERANVTVISSTKKEVNVYTEKDGTLMQVGAFKNVSGTKKLEFDVVEGIQNLVVSDGEVALRAVVGGIVDLDNQTSMMGLDQALETRGGEYVDRNMWARKYVVPANITVAESLAVVEEFSKQHYGAYNEVLVPWTELFVQQVHKGVGTYYDAFNQATGVASDKMNHLLIWDNASGEGAFNGGYIHVNDFNSGNQTTVAYDDYDTNKEHPIIGLTLMLNVDPTNCPTEEVTLKNEAGEDVTKTWVKQFCYHNSQSSEYQPTYIMKRVTWVEDNVMKSGVYLGFDFYAQKRPDQPADKNMDVERDWIFNDWIIKLSQGLDVQMPVSALEDAEPAAWILAGEDLGGGFDIDYNDVVVKVERKTGEDSVTVTPLAAGGTLASYLFFGQTCVGEIHQLLDAPSSQSGSYQPLNLGSDIKVATKSVRLNVGRDWSLSEDISEANNMGGFTIRVLPAGTAAMPMTLNYNDRAFDKATDVKAPVLGQAPYILCVPFSYTMINYPKEGEKMENVWSWPEEQTYINDPYPYFERWVQNKNNYSDWFSKPSNKGFVSTKEFARRVLGVQPKKMTNNEVQVSRNPNADVSFYNAVLPSVYPVLKAPEAYLTLVGDSNIYVKTGDIIDVLDYVNVTEAYREQVFCKSGSTGAMAPVDGSFTQLECLETNPGVTTVGVKLARPGGVLNVNLIVHYNQNSSGTTTNKKSATVYLLNSNNESISYIPEITVGETRTYTISGEGSNNVTVSTSGSSLTATINGNTLSITGVSAGSQSLSITRQGNDEYSDVSAYFNVTVVGQPAKQSSTMTLSQSSISIEQGQSVNLSSYVQNLPAGATISYAIASGNAGTINGSTFTASTSATGDVYINITHAATDNYEAGSQQIKVTVTEKATTGGDWKNCTIDGLHKRIELVIESSSNGKCNVKYNNEVILSDITTLKILWENVSGDQFWVYANDWSYNGQQIKGQTSGVHTMTLTAGKTLIVGSNGYGDLKLALEGK